MIKIGDSNFEWGKKTYVMGVLNVTPDSFADGGLFFETSKAVEHAKQMAFDGADIIDIGGESAKPGSEPISEEEELNRVQPVIKELVKDGISIPISIDTNKPAVAEKCLEVGARMVNDTTGLKDKDMARVVAQHRIPVVIMHMKGTPKTMQADPTYEDVVEEIKEFMRQRIKVAKEAGIQEVIIDPGIGFGKTTEHNLQILKRLHEFQELGCPILIGTSRKSFIGNLTGGLPVTERLEGTLVSLAVAIMNGANIVRVHDVKETKRAIQVVDAIKYI
ncbi:dihydropteroate synthase [Patescibacteria group bacterium]|nr:dihydropteroate synthase [Patescibacteria group bacterium]